MQKKTFVGHPDPAASAQEIGWRLALTRQALECTTTKMCEFMGSSTGGSAYSNYEQGHRTISLKHALALCMACSLTMDWVYRGDDRNLPPGLRKKIRALQVGRRQRANS